MTAEYGGGGPVTGARSANALERSIAFSRDLERARAGRIERTRVGDALFEDTLPLVFYLNVLSVDLGVAASAEELAAEADAVQQELHHRKVSVYDDAHGEALATSFRALGWTVEPLVVMCFGSARRDPPAAVRDVPRGVLEPLWLGGIRDAGMSDEEARQLVAAKSVNERASRVSYFAALVEGQPGSYCELYSRDGVGQIEGVLTLPHFRGRGLASAVVLHAAAESARRGNDLTFLVAEEEDWPKDLYAKLGFDRVGRIWDFIRRPRDGEAGGDVR